MDLALSMHDSQRDLFPSLVIPDVKSRGTYYVQCPDCKKDVKKGTSCCGVQRGILPSICFDDTDELNHLAIDDDEPAKDMM
ncbi:hypothetical protein BBAD15_g5100 [Beauveria bassiana D1-5]|uniref:Uncharacterized protein n=2 Tax=Beauveria bassiana TaxID=176275 RepID=A0A0A2VPM2_BEABA|nr:hypothetical protein BBAD15_g5100 [Beauveria bassiana D1-5]PMB72254.1 hypothetical protein BM221_002356 [Beauveria bassiana]